MDEPLAGKRCLVTGASRGLGRAIALALARSGADVAVNFLARREAAEEVVRAVEALGRRACAVQGDVSQPAAAASIVREAIERLGGLDVLVNNSGISRDRLIFDSTPDDWAAVIGVNLLGTVHCTRAALEHFMPAGSGVVINISSVAADRAWPGNASYAASKAAVNAFTRAAAVEAARFGVRVVAVAPGFCATEMTESAMRQVGDRLRRSLPMRRFVEPEDVAAAVVFLASPAAAQISGSVLYVDGAAGVGMRME